ncbi:MAG: hypothetical protein QOD84_2440 [Acidobacteriaceae bacterium]|jgi:hypothetical protein
MLVREQSLTHEPTDSLIIEAPFRFIGCTGAELLRAQEGCVRDGYSLRFEDSVAVLHRTNIFSPLHQTLRCSAYFEGRMSTEFDQFEDLYKHVVFNPEKVCNAVARIFEVGVDEVGLLRLQERTLKFLFPPSLQTARGIHPSSSATAAETALSMKAFIFNDFAQRKHDSIFEVVAAGLDADQALRPIQKLMSAPVIYENSGLGVIQVCRKGITRDVSGPDFDAIQLAKLERAAVYIGELMHTQNISGSEGFA